MPRRGKIVRRPVLPDAKYNNTNVTQFIGRIMLNGKRSLAGFMSEKDEAAWRLIRAAGVPVRMHEVEGGLYYELDLMALMRS